MRTRFIQKYLQLESTSGIILFIMTLFAMVWANSRYAAYYQQFTTTFLFWINEGLMAVFFLFVGLELKRGYLDGELGDFRQILLPLVAAFGGMVVPILIYCAVNYDDAFALKGWSIPVATDIAFALGILSFFKGQISLALKLFLLSLAIFDDIGAILIIAVFFTSNISYLWISLSALIFAMLYLFNRWHVQSLIPYVVLGICLWGSLLNSGIHPTISGILIALLIPDGSPCSLLRQLETKLHPWVAYFIMPLFALTNAGVMLSGIDSSVLVSGVVLGTILGLLIGKPLGIFTISWLAIHFKLAKMPRDTSWLNFFGISVLCGVGFTMSLFLGTLSFQNEAIYLAKVRIAVIVGSILSGLLGALILYFSLCPKKNRSKFC